MTEQSYQNYHMIFSTFHKTYHDEFAPQHLPNQTHCCNKFVFKEMLHFLNISSIYIIFGSTLVRLVMRRASCGRLWWCNLLVYKECTNQWWICTRKWTLSYYVIVETDIYSLYICNSGDRYIYIYAHYASTENWLFVKNGDTDVGNAVTHEIWKVCMLVVKMIDENN